MQNTTVLFLGIAMLVLVIARASDKARPSRLGHLRGGQKIFGVIAIVLTLLILLNPDALALGLLGDTAFVDVLVLALSLQMSHFAMLACHQLAAVLSKMPRWLGIPSPGLRLLLLYVTPFFIGAMTFLKWNGAGRLPLAKSTKRFFPGGDEDSFCQ